MNDQISSLKYLKIEDYFNLFPSSSSSSVQFTASSIQSMNQLSFEIILRYLILHKLRSQ